MFADYLETRYIVPRLVNVSVTFFNFIVVNSTPLNLDIYEIMRFLIGSSNEDIIATLFRSIGSLLSLVNYRF